MQTAQAFQKMIAALSWPIDNMQKLAECRASIARVAGLYRSLVTLRDRLRDDHVECVAIEEARPGRRRVTPSRSASLAGCCPSRQQPVRIDASREGDLGDDHSMPLAAHIHHPGG
ncbi:MAG: hypothetical protein AB7P21_23030 [Lautropia sp.]